MKRSGRPATAGGPPLTDVEDERLGESLTLATADDADRAEGAHEPETEPCGRRQRDDDERQAALPRGDAIHVERDVDDARAADIVATGQRRREVRRVGQADDR